MRRTLALLLLLSGCVGVAWTDRETGEVRGRVYTPADLLPEGEDAGTGSDG